MAKGAVRNLARERAAIEAAAAQLEERRKRLAEAETAEALAAIERIARKNVKESLAVLDAARAMGFQEALYRLERPADTAPKGERAVAEPNGS